MADEMTNPGPRLRRVMALDVGERRIGVAISDFEGRIAAPMTTIRAEPRPRALEQLAALMRENEVQELVVGLPLTLRGEIGPQAQAVQAFAKALERVLTANGQAVPLHFFDERLTTAAAEQMMRDLGVKPEKRKERIDEVAASIILQDFLDHSRAQGR